MPFSLYSPGASYHVATETIDHFFPMKSNSFAFCNPLGSLCLSLMGDSWSSADNSSSPALRWRCFRAPVPAWVSPRVTVSASTCRLMTLPSVFLVQTSSFQLQFLQPIECKISCCEVSQMLELCIANTNPSSFPKPAPLPYSLAQLGPTLSLLRGACGIILSIVFLSPQILPVSPPRYFSNLLPLFHSNCFCPSSGSHDVLSGL